MFWLNALFFLENGLCCDMIGSVLFQMNMKPFLWSSLSSMWRTFTTPIPSPENLRCAVTSCIPHCLSQLNSTQTTRPYSPGTVVDLTELDRFKGIVHTNIKKIISDFLRPPRLTFIDWVDPAKCHNPQIIKRKSTKYNQEIRWCLCFSILLGM